MGLTSELEEFSSDWAKKFSTEARELTPIFGSSLLGIHHVGSTAIPGMLAKPEIDILIVIKVGSPLHEYIPAIEEHRYRFRSDVNFPEGHLFFSKDLEGKRTHKIHLCTEGNPNIERQLSFRDFLIANPDQALEYRNLKLHLAKTNTGGMAEYLEKKAPFIDEIMRNIKK